MKNIIFIAPPAAGKGTLSELIVEKYGYEHISIGELLRNEVEAGSEFGEYIHKCQTDGILVSDDITVNVLKNKLKTLDNNKRFILDGFPRSISQLHLLNELFNELGIKDVVAIYLDNDPEVLMERALGRLVCPECGHSYHASDPNFMPKVEGICDDCKCNLTSRSDDNRESFMSRLNTYNENTLPLLDYYEKDGILYKVNNGGTPDEIFKRIESVIK